jgi:plastocyanin
MSPFVLADASINVYVITGGAFAVWAVVVSLLGMRGFPSNLGGQRLAIGITAVLFVAAVGTAIADTTKVGERKGPEKEEKPAGGAETKAPSQPAPSGGSAAPSTGSGQKAPSGKPTALALTADPSGTPKYDKASLSAPAGQVTITMTNPSPVGHDVALKGGGVNEKGEVVQGNQKSTVKATLKPGQYEYYCTVPGHEQAGMRGTLTVK